MWERSCNSEVIHLLLSTDGKRPCARIDKKRFVGHFSIQHLSVKLAIMFWLIYITFSWPLVLKETANY